MNPLLKAYREKLPELIFRLSADELIDALDDVFCKLKLGNHSGFEELMFIGTHIRGYFPDRIECYVVSRIKSCDEFDLPFICLFLSFHQSNAEASLDLVDSLLFRLQTLSQAGDAESLILALASCPTTAAVTRSNIQTAIGEAITRFNVQLQPLTRDAVNYSQYQVP